MKGGGLRLSQAFHEVHFHVQKENVQMNKHQHIINGAETCGFCLLKILFVSFFLVFFPLLNPP